MSVMMSPKFRVPDSLTFKAMYLYSPLIKPENEIRYTFVYFIPSYVWVQALGLYAPIIRMCLRINIQSVI
jgi:hypothetical protein